MIHAEELGFDIATTADQFVGLEEPDGPVIRRLGRPCRIAEATEGIRLAPCVAQIPMRDPATYAREILTVDHISDGRIEAGLGVGLTVDLGYGMIGVPNWESPSSVPM